MDCDEMSMGGPLADHADRLREHLRGLGYKDFQVQRHVCVAVELGEWMERRGLALSGLTECLAEFFADRRRAGQRWLVSTGAAKPLLGYLRGAGVLVESPGPSSPGDVLVGRYRRFLVDRRGLAAGTVAGYERAARLFLAATGDDVAALGSLTAAEVSGFVTEACAHPVKVSPRELVSALRSFLRFLFVEQVIAAPLAQAVPSYASRRAGGLPKYLTADQTALLLASCDRRRAIGRRDYAVLVVLARLGLRAGQVAGLRLDDIDWRGGELRVRTKPRREERLPLPADVGLNLPLQRATYQALVGLLAVSGMFSGGPDLRQAAWGPTYPQVRGRWLPVGYRDTCGAKALRAGLMARAARR